MQFHSLSDFFAMGGYAFYVWLSYGMTVLSLGGLVLLSLYQRKKILRNINIQSKRAQRLAAKRSNNQ